MDAEIPDGVAYAAVLTHNPRTGETNYTAYRSDEGHENPKRNAIALRESCEDDFPGWIWTLACNDRAIKVYSDWLVESLLGHKGEKND